MAKVITRINRAVSKVGKAKKELEAAIRKAFPIGQIARWKKGGNLCEGKVVMFSCGTDRILVQNIRTGAEYWIGYYFMIERGHTATVLDKQYN